MTLCVCVCVCACQNMHKHTQTHTNIYIYIYTHTHTHTHTLNTGSSGPATERPQPLSQKTQLSYSLGIQIHKHTLMFCLPLPCRRSGSPHPYICWLLWGMSIEFHIIVINHKTTEIHHSAKHHERYDIKQMANNNINIMLLISMHIVQYQPYTVMW